MDRKKARFQILLPRSCKHATALWMVLITLLYVVIPSNQAFTPCDPVGGLWHLETIKIHSVWDHGYSFHSSGSVGLCVVGEAIIDDQHGDLNVTEKSSFAWDDDYTSYLPYPDTETSTHEAAVASVAASTINNGIGVAGIVNAPLFSAWLWGTYLENEPFSYQMYIQQMMDTFDWGVSFGKIVFTMSFLATAYSLEEDDPNLIELQDKVSELYESGEALFFAGVDNLLCPLHPMDIPQSLPYVRAIGRFDNKGTFLEGGYGEPLFLVAPTGVPAYNQITGTYGIFGGSSCSTPIAAAAAVLLWNQFPWATNAQIEDALCWGAIDILEPGWDEHSGYGMLNVENAREYLAEHVPSANTYQLNRTDMPTDRFPTTNSTTYTDFNSSLFPVYLSISVPIIASTAALLIAARTKQKPGHDQNSYVPS